MCALGSGAWSGCCGGPAIWDWSAFWFEGFDSGSKRGVLVAALVGPKFGTDPSVSSASGSLALADAVWDVTWSATLGGGRSATLLTYVGG